MMRDRLYRVQAIVLKRTDYGEADRLLTLFTPDLGKVRAIAKGARKPSSRKSGHVELFTHAAMLIARGRHLDIVTQAETVEAFLPLRENLDRLGFAYYLAELVDQFSEEGDTSSRGDRQPVFDLLLHALGWLGEPVTDPALLARFFELHLLQHVGYRPQLFACVNCGAPIEPVSNYISADAGGVLDAKCAQAEDAAALVRLDLQPLSLSTLKVLRFLQTREWESVRALRLNADAHAQVEAVLERHIAHHLERNLKSMDFIRTLRQPVVTLETAPLSRTV
jgi:DNA repair protein RecO (recombination protein O)